MSELREVFEMTTRQIEPDLDAWREQERRQQWKATRRKQGAILLAAALAIASTVIVVDAMRKSEGTGPKPAGQGTPSPTAEISLIGNPTGIVEAGGSIWVSTYSGELYRIDPTTNEITARIDIGPSSCGDLVADGSTLLVSGCGYWPPVATVRIDATTGRVLDRWQTDLVSPVVGDGRAWAFDAGAPNRDGVEVDPWTGKVIKILPSPPIGFAFGSLWFAGTGSDGLPNVVRVDPNTYEMQASYSLPQGTSAGTKHGQIGGFAESGGYVWVIGYSTEPGLASLYRIDPSSRNIDRVLPITFEAEPAYSGPGPAVFVDARDGVVWVAEAPDRVVGVDATTGALVGVYPAAAGSDVQVSNAASTGDSLWVLNYADYSVWRYDLLKN